MAKKRKNMKQLIKSFRPSMVLVINASATPAQQLHIAAASLLML